MLRVSAEFDDFPMEVRYLWRKSGKSVNSKNMNQPLIDDAHFRSNQIHYNDIKSNS